MKSVSRQAKLEDHAQAFSDLKRRLKMKLLLIINTTVAQTKLASFASESKLDDVLRLLRRRTELETGLAHFIANPGTVTKAMKDDESMRRLIRKFEAVDEMAPMDSASPWGSPVPEHHPQPARADSVPFGQSARWPDSNPRPYGTEPYLSPFSHFDMAPHPHSTPSRYMPQTTSTPARYTPLPKLSSHPSSVPTYPGRLPPFHPIYFPTYPGDHPSYPTFVTPGAPQDNAFRPPQRRSSLPLPHTSGSTAYIFQVPKRASMRISAGMRRPYEEVLDQNGSVKPILIEQYRSEMQYALSTELQSILKKNEQVWVFKMEHFTSNLARHFDQGTQRVLAAITGGPHERIKDPELRLIWETEVRPLGFRMPSTTPEHCQDSGGEAP